MSETTQEHYVSGSNPSTFGRRINLLGKGSYGEVWLYRMHSTDCAVKETPAPDLSGDDCAIQESAIIELSIARKIRNHENVIAPQKVVIDDLGATFGAMPVALSTLWNMAKMRSSPIPAETSFACMDQMLRALDLLHSLGICHLDVSPSNILVRIHEGDQPWMALSSPRTTFALSDFGFSATSFSRHQERAWCVYQVIFRAPEHIASSSSMSDRYIGEPIDGFRSDVWALGCTAAWMMTRATVLDSLWMWEAERLGDALEGDSVYSYPAEAAAVLLSKIEDHLGKRAFCTDGKTRKMEAVLESEDYSWRMSASIVARARDISAARPSRCPDISDVMISEHGTSDAGRRTADLAVRMMEIDPRERPTIRSILGVSTTSAICTYQRSEFARLSVERSEGYSLPGESPSALSEAVSEAIETAFLSSDASRCSRTSIVESLRTAELARHYSRDAAVDSSFRTPGCDSCIVLAAARAASAYAFAASFSRLRSMSHNTVGWMVRRAVEILRPVTSASFTPTWNKSTIIACAASLARDLDADFDVPTASGVAEAIICGGEALRELRDPTGSGILSLACALVGFALARSDVRERVSNAGMYVAYVATRDAMISKCGIVSITSMSRIIEARNFIFRDVDSFEKLSNAAIGSLCEFIGSPNRTSISVALDMLGWTDRISLTKALSL